MRPGVARAEGCGDQMANCQRKGMEFCGGERIAGCLYRCCVPGQECCKAEDRYGVVGAGCCPVDTMRGNGYPSCPCKIPCGPEGLTCCSVKDQEVCLQSTKADGRSAARPSGAATASAAPRARSASVASASCRETRVPRPGFKPKGGGGCGPEGGPQVPNGYKKASFLRACRLHDRCYDTCRSKRSECDEKFTKRMKNACKNTYPVPGTPNRVRCMRRAELYSDAVTALGSFAYNEAQSKACQCCP